MIARPGNIQFTGALPKTRSGKIIRRFLRNLASGEEVVGDATTMEDQSAAMNKPSEQQQFAICIANDNCDDLQILKIYRLLSDQKAAEKSCVRVIDDSGEDYLYPANCFITAEFSTAVTQRLIAAIPC